MRPVRRRRSMRRIVRYVDARSLLIERLGDYCSYCERPTVHAIEHVLPWEATQAGSQHTRLETSWTNFLLTCHKCNIFKAKRQDATPYNNRLQARERYYWPDTDNTFRAYQYHRTGDVVAHPRLNTTEAAKATATLAIFGFEKDDLRKHRRADAWVCAELQLGVWTRAPTEQTLDVIMSSAGLSGHWSIWYTVFAAHPRVLARLNKVFPGTARSCFDPQSCATIARRKGKL